MEKGGSALQILRGSSLPQVVQEEIQRMILEGEFEPGEKLGEVELAMRLGVSRGPVREAFRGLEEVGLISFAKNRGVFIRQHSIEEIRELYIVRAGLEEMIGRLLTPKITKPEIKELYDYIERMENSYSYNGARGYFDLNMKFHDRIAEIAGNQNFSKSTVGLQTKLCSCVSAAYPLAVTSLLLARNIGRSWSRLRVGIRFSRRVQ